MIAQRANCPSLHSPLRVGLVVFVAFMLNHTVPSNADVRPGHLHAIQGDARGQEQGGISVRAPGWDIPQPRDLQGHTSGKINLSLLKQSCAKMSKARPHPAQCHNVGCHMPHGSVPKVPLPSRDWQLHSSRCCTQAGSHPCAAIHPFLPSSFPLRPLPFTFPECRCLALPLEPSAQIKGCLKLFQSSTDSLSPTLSPPCA